MRGCMPTKALLHAAELRHQIGQGATWGIHAGSVTVNMAELLAMMDGGYDCITAVTSSQRVCVNEAGGHVRSTAGYLQ